MRMDELSSTIANKASSIFPSIYDHDVREDSTFKRISDHDINLLRSTNLVPGSELKLGRHESRVPVLIVKNEPTDTEFGGGHDIVLPSGWGMSAWMGLVYQGARTCGLKGTESLSLYGKKLLYPVDYPDTPAGKREEDTITNELKNKYFRYPPAKRRNYIKLGVLAPFSHPWLELVSQWRVKLGQEPCDAFYVIRDRKFLKRLSAEYTDPSVKIDKLKDKLLNLYSSGLLAVDLEMVGRGVCSDFAQIYLPEKEELSQLSEFGACYDGLTEPIHKDALKKQRKDLKAARIKLRKKLQKQRKNETESKDGDQSKPESIQDEINESWLPPMGDNVIDYNQRSTIGYVKRGGYNFRRGRSTAIGLCSALGLKQLMELCVVDGEVFRFESCYVVLVRCTDSFQYRFAKIKIINS